MLNQPIFGITLLVILAYLYFECLRLQILASGLGKWISFRSSAEFTLGGIFLTITPLGIGGLPLQLYVLNREGMGIGRGTSVIIMRAVITFLIVPFFLPFVFIYSQESFWHGLVGGLIKYVIILVTALIILGLLVTLRPPHRIRKFLYKFAKSDRGRNWVDKIVQEIIHLKEAIKDYGRHGKLRLLWAFLLTFVARGLYFFFPYTLLRGLNLDPPLIQTMMIQMVYSCVLLYMPTPGASGIAEAAGMGLYSAICPKYLLGVFVLLWRFFSPYIAMMMGAFLVLRLVSGIGKNNKNTTAQH
ncbi:MAG TPA: flippase-like domain-containing protein [bacterium (Candidatus Stahlbacteria)]|nr:flippase-like domain-containing protein [Candidatus Stahlbacteria bacterium]